MAKKHFSVALLKIGDCDFTLDSFSSIQENEVDNQEINGEIQHNKIIKKEIRDNRFVLLYFEEGETIPRPDVVYNRITQIDEDNPRSIDQIERDSQTFVLIDIQTQKIFISNFKKKKTLEDWLCEKTNKTVVIKNIIDRADFLNELRGIDIIYLSAVPNLFSSMGILSEELTSDHHNYGVGIKHIGVKIYFEKNSVPQTLKNKIFELFQQKDNDSIQKLEVSGRHDDKFERVFNAEGIIDKVTIEAALRVEGLFDRNQVFNNLIYKIG